MLFSPMDYQTAIFKGTLPTFMAFPFKGMPHSPFKNRAFIMRLLQDDEALFNYTIDSTLSVMKRALPGDVEQIPEMLLYALRNEYLKAKYEWVGYRDLMPLIESPVSKIIWANYKYEGKAAIGNPEELLDIQKYWIYINDRIDRKDSMESNFAMFEYLSAFVNPERYQKLQESKDYRDNVSYEEMHQALLDGKLDKIEQVI